MRIWPIVHRATCLTSGIARSRARWRFTSTAAEELLARLQGVPEPKQDRVCATGENRETTYPLKQSAEDAS
jgi:hypothetical protein